MKKNLTIICIAAVIIVIGFIAGVYASQPNSALGSTVIGNEYKATTTRTYNGTAIPGLYVLNSNPGTLGSIVITGAAAGVIHLYDGTSTVTNLGWPTTTLATIPASAAAGTYTFDVSYYKGLIVEVIGTTPTSTITYR